MSWIDSLCTLIVVLVWGFNFVVVKVGVSEIPPLLLTALRFAVVAALVVPFTRRPRGKLWKIALMAFLLGAAHFGLLFLALQRMDAASTAIAVQLTVPFSAVVAAIFYREKLGRRGILGMALAYIGVALVAGEPQHPDLIALVMVVVCSIAWALANVVIKSIGAINPLTLTGWMALMGLPQLLALSLLFEDNQLQSLSNAGWRGWGAVAYTAVIASLVGYGLWCWLINRHPVNKVVPYTLLNPVVSVVAGVLLLAEPLGWHKLVGGALTLLGVAVIQIRSLGVFGKARTGSVSERRS